MYDDFDDDDDYRNARRRTMRSRPPVQRPVVIATRPTPRPVAEPTMAYPAPWAPPPASPLVDRYTGRVKFGVIADAVAQAFAAFAALPSPPPIQGDPRTDTQNLVKYQEQLAQHAKRDEQIRTIGALVRQFLV